MDRTVPLEVKEKHLNVKSHKDTGEIIFKHKGKWRALKDDKSMGLRDIGRSMLLKGLGGMWPGVAHSAEVIIAILSKKYARKPLAQPLGKIGLAPGSTWNKAASQAIGAAQGVCLGKQVDKYWLNICQEKAYAA